MGNLIELSNPNEKLSTDKGSSTTYAKFSNFISTNGLIDSGHGGIPFTWNNNREAIKDVHYNKYAFFPFFPGG